MRINAIAAVARDQARTRTRHLKRNYGLTPADVDHMSALQGRSCGICRATFLKTPFVDHDHATGKVRGLLCTKCNTLLGMAKDSMTTLMNALVYLENHSCA